MIPIKRPQRNPGFSFMEVLVALCMIGLVLTALFGLQNSVFKRVSYAHNLTQKSLALQNLLIDHSFMNNLFDNAGKIEKRLEQPPMDLKTTLVEPSSTSELKRFNHIRLISLVGDGEKLVTIVYWPQLAEDPKDRDKAKIKIDEAAKTGAIDA